MVRFTLNVKVNLHFKVRNMNNLKLYVVKYFIILTILIFTSCQRVFSDIYENEKIECEYCKDKGSLSLYEVKKDQITLKREFDVKPKYLKDQMDKDKHTELWNLVTKLIPYSFRKHISEFVVFKGNGDMLGYVQHLNADLTEWVFGLDIYSAYEEGDFNANGDIAYTAIHEFAHLLTLNNGQLDPRKDFFECKNFHTTEGCSMDSSYMKIYFDRFWSDIEHKRWGWKLYKRFPDRFVTDYAASNPGEDIAESFTFFVIQDKPVGNRIMDEKIKFFYNFPELVQLRNHIRNQNVILPTGPLSNASKRVHMQHHH